MNDETISIVRQVVKCAASNAVHADRVEARGEAEFLRTVHELVRNIEKAYGVVDLLNESRDGMEWALETICHNHGVSIGEAKGMASMMEKAERTARELIRDIAIARDAAAILHARGDEPEAALLKEGKVLGLEWALDVVCHFHGLDVQAVKEGMEDDEQDDG